MCCRHLWKVTPSATGAGEDKHYALANLDTIQSQYTQLEQLKKEGARANARELREMTKEFLQGPLGTDTGLGAGSKASSSMGVGSGASGSMGSGANASNSSDLQRTKTQFRLRSITGAHDGDNEEQSGVSDDERAIAGEQLEMLKSQYGAAFSIAEEEEYFLELLQLRAKGAYQWNTELEKLFRDQLQVNCTISESVAGNREGYAQVLDQLSLAYILGHPIEQSQVDAARLEAEILLESMLSRRTVRVEFSSEAARAAVLNRVVRKIEEGPHWLGARDETELEKLICDSSVQRDGVDGRSNRLLGSDGRLLESDEQLSRHGDTVGIGSDDEQYDAHSPQKQKYGYDVRTDRSFALNRYDPVRFGAGTGSVLRTAVELDPRTGYSNAFSSPTRQVALPPDQPIDVSHVKSTIDCGQRRGRQRKRRTKKATHLRNASMRTRSVSPTNDSKTSIRATSFSEQKSRRVVERQECVSAPPLPSLSSPNTGFADFMASIRAQPAQPARARCSA